MGTERTMGQLISDAGHEISDLIRYEIALFKAEVRTGLTRIMAGIAMFAVAALVGVLGVIMLVIAAALGLAEALPAWLAFAIVALGLFAAGAVWVAVGVRQLRRVGPPTRRVAAATKNASILRATRKGPNP
jgi:hypothetical protein